MEIWKKLVEASNQEQSIYPEARERESHAAGW
jgi:hypothetical protein